MSCDEMTAEYIHALEKRNVALAESVATLRAACEDAMKHADFGPLWPALDATKDAAPPLRPTREEWRAEALAWRKYAIASRSTQMSPGVLWNALADAIQIQERNDALEAAAPATTEERES